MMKLVNNTGEISALMQSVKSNNKLLITNFFAEPKRLTYWLDNKLIFFDQTEDGVLLFRKNNFFYHLYYAAVSLESLKTLLDTSELKMYLVADIIGAEQNLKAITGLFTSKGFRKHAQLDRYVRINNVDSTYFQSSDEVTFAEMKDADTLTQLFTKNFDSFSEQIPDLNEVEILIKQKKNNTSKTG